MKFNTFFLSALLLLPVTSHAAGLDTFLTGFTTFLSDIVIPFLIGVAFLFFIINAIRYFVIESTNEDGREKAKALAIYGVTAFVIIIIFWGIVVMLVDGIGLGGETQTCPDYMVGKPGGC